MTKKILTVILAALLLTALAAPALAEDDPTIRVSGNATVSLAADTAVVQVGVNTRKTSVQEAQSENAALMNAVIEAIKAAGVADKDIITSQFNVFSNYEYRTESLGRESRTLYYEVQNNVSVTIHDMSMIGAVLDTAMAAGANTSYGITFSSTEENEAYLKALARAYEDAEKKAQVLCAAAGKTLGTLTLINASQSSFDYGVRNLYSAKGAETAEAVADTSIISGDVSVSATVTLEFTIR